jgi:predicted O-methyltransferase YrrM
MSQERWSAVDRFIAEMIVPADPALDAALADSAAADLPAISVSPNQGKLLHLLARVKGARHILEVGRQPGAASY